MLELRLAVEGLERTILASAAKIERRAAAGDIDVDEALEACEEITGRHTLAELGLEPSEAQS